jgi:hypothetical protein
MSKLELIKIISLMMVLHLKKYNSGNRSLRTNWCKVILNNKRKFSGIMI